MKLSHIYKPIILQMEFIDPYTDEKTGIFLKFHSIRSFFGKVKLHEIQLKNIEMQEKGEEIDNIAINKELLINLFDSFSGLEDDDGKTIESSKKSFEAAINESQELLNACLVFVSNSGNSSRKLEKDL